MILVTVGTGTVAPSATRTASAHWIEYEDTRLLLDCGPGTMHRLAQFGLRWANLDAVWISHFHPDHFAELPFLVFALRHATEPVRSAPLAVDGPPGLRSRLERLAAAFGEWLRDPGFPLVVTEVAAGQQSSLSGKLLLETHDTPHTEESLAVRISCPDGNLVYTSDTGESEALARWAAGCDLLLTECSLPEHRALDLHLTPERAGDLARQSQTKKLVLTHFYPPVELTDPVASAATRYHGEIVAAHDGARFEIKAA